MGPFPVPLEWEFRPDRRPVVFVPLYISGHGANPLGVEPKWYDDDIEDPCAVSGTDVNPANGAPDVFERLMEMLNRLYDDGYRRIVLYVPAGNVDNQTYMSSSQWYTMPEWRRQAFEDYVAPWIEAKAWADAPVSMGVYAGYRIDDPCSHDTTSAAYPDLEDSDDTCTVYQNIQPWIDLGFTEYWFDASAGGPGFVTLQFSDDYYGVIKFGGEAIPVTGGSCTPDPLTFSYSTPDMTRIEQAAWVANFAHIRGRLDYSTSFDPETTEVGIMITGHEVTCGIHKDDGVTFEDAVHYYNQGFVLWVESKYNMSTIYEYSFRRSEELARRIYSFGPLTAMVDMNNDGFLDVSSTSDTDYALFLDAFMLNSGNPGGYLDGDVNGDGFVDVFDFLDFADAAAQWECSQPCTPAVVGTNLGDPWWVP